jgi:hypothetical protein
LNTFASILSWWPASIVAGLVTFVLCLTALPPSIEDLERTAAELVLPESRLTYLGANTGATIIVGWERWAVADYEDDRHAEEVAQLLVLRAGEVGWTVKSTALLGPGVVIELERPLYEARIRSGPQFDRGEPTEASAGHVTVSRDEDQRFVLFWGLVAASALVFPIAAHLAWPSGHPEPRLDPP